ncbi:hypothetical protein XOCgx_0659 [Xanthomonas oryzae pv. oryzicola]|nr:hypothetical protein XOCgx_0659 [Xanthomonas oryzae pv. oryzicola]
MVGAGGANSSPELPKVRNFPTAASVFPWLTYCQGAVQ